MNPEPVIKPGEIITWMGLAFETNDQVLVPRRETELLARTALDLLKTVEAAAPISVIDIAEGPATSPACSRMPGRIFAFGRAISQMRGSRSRECCAAPA
jgi:hypothetical protein